MGWNEGIKKELKYCGENVYIGYNTIFTNPSNIFIGDNVRIDPFCLITTGLHCEKNIQICSHVVMQGGNEQMVWMDEWTFIAYGSKLLTASEDQSGDYGPVNEFWGNNKVFRGDIIMMPYSGFSTDVTVFPGVQLPLGCTIGAQSLVRPSSQLLPWAIYLGNPLRFHKWRNGTGIRNAVNSKDFHK